MVIGWSLTMLEFFIVIWDPRHQVLFADVDVGVVWAYKHITGWAINSHTSVFIKSIKRFNVNFDVFKTSLVFAAEDTDEPIEFSTCMCMKIGTNIEKHNFSFSTINLLFHTLLSMASFKHYHMEYVFISYRSLCTYFVWSVLTERNLIIAEKH